jgi:hypothetical protein
VKIYSADLNDVLSQPDGRPLSLSKAGVNAMVEGNGESEISNKDKYSSKAKNT